MVAAPVVGTLRQKLGKTKFMCARTLECFKDNRTMVECIVHQMEGLMVCQCTIICTPKPAVNWRFLPWVFQSDIHLIPAEPGWVNTVLACYVTPFLGMGYYYENTT